MKHIFVGQIEALDPQTKTIYIEFLPLKKTKDSVPEVYTVELKKTTQALSEFLQKIKAKVDPKYRDKISSYKKFSDALLKRKLGEIFVLKSDISKLINKFNIQSRVLEGLVQFSRSVTLDSPTKVGEIIYPKNSILKFTYKD
jgi:hypothetical protein